MDVGLRPDQCNEKIQMWEGLYFLKINPRFKWNDPPAPVLLSDPHAH